MLPLLLFLPILAQADTVRSHRFERRLDNGLALTPPMGWNSYNHYSCQPNESIVMSNAQALVDLELAELGYQYVTTDCGWTLPERNANGTLPWNETIFPRGMPALADYIHSLGLKAGFYSDAGVQMCMTGLPNQTGSLFHESLDASTFASWGADLLKYDNCYSSADHGYPDADYSPTSSPAPRYATMRAALNSTGRSILYQICDWGVDFPSAWAPALGNTWRITNDIIPAWRTMYRIVNQVVPQTSYAGPGHWLDLDMLEVGNNLFTIPEEQTHFSLWAIMKSPLVIGCALNDTLTSIKPGSLAILKNEEVIALNQDSLGVSANLSRRYTEEEYDIWSGPLSHSRLAVAVVNWRNSTRDLTLNFSDVGLASAATVHDIWLNKTIIIPTASYTRSVPAHGTILLVLSDTTPSLPRKGGNFYPATSFTASGNASLVSCTSGLCPPVGSKIAWLDPSSFASFTTPVATGDGSRYVELYYVNNDVALSTSWTNGTNARNITVRVNDGPSVRLEVPLSGRSSELFSSMKGWGDVGVLPLEVGGWKSEGTDTIVIGNEGGEKGVVLWGADFVGMRVYK